MGERLVELASAPLGSLMALLAGAALGLVFYGGLWWTVRRAATFRRPGPSVLCSLLLRMSLALWGFYLVGGDDWVRLMTCLAGFLLARAGVTWLSRVPCTDGSDVANHAASRAAIGSGHAP